MAERERDTVSGGSEPVGRHFDSTIELLRRLHQRLFLAIASTQVVGLLAVGLNLLDLYRGPLFEGGWLIVSTSAVALTATFGVAIQAIRKIRNSEASILREAAPAAAAHRTFSELVDEWHRERGATSSITAMAMCPSYQKIIGLGPRAIPLIMRRMEVEGGQPDMWFWALRVLTGADPVADSDRGDTVRMAQAWLRWGRERYAW